MAEIHSKKSQIDFFFASVKEVMTLGRKLLIIEFQAWRHVKTSLIRIILYYKALFLKILFSKWRSEQLQVRLPCLNHRYLRLEQSLNIRNIKSVYQIQMLFIFLLFLLKLLRVFVFVTQPRIEFLGIYFKYGTKICQKSQI